ncbi:Alpha-glucan water dikinase 2 [Linum perenne]
MAASKVSPTPRAHQFQLVDGMQLKINVSGSLNGRNVRVELQLHHCTRTWVLHWGCTFPGNKSWFIPTDVSNSYKPGALQTPFTKSGDLYVVNIELRDPKVIAIEFVLKDGSHDRWLKLNNGNFRVELPEHDEIPKDLIERRAYQIWERQGRPITSPQQQKQNFDDALRELQDQLSRGLSLDDLRTNSNIAITRTPTHSREEYKDQTISHYQKRHDVTQWLHKPLVRSKSTSRQVSALMDLVEKSYGGDNVLSRQSHYLGNCEVAVLQTLTQGDLHVLVAMNIKGSIVLHWGISKLCSGEWLAPPPGILPEKSKLVPGACQTYFTEVATAKGFFQVVDINVRQQRLDSIQFVIWTGGSWIKNNGANFSVNLIPINILTFELFGIQAGGDKKGIINWLLDEIAHREKEAERSLMHRFNIATELTERCKVEGELGFIGILVWLRFMACRHLTWNKNYNVKPREISEAQDRFTNLLQRIYLSDPSNREIVRLIMSCVGRGGKGDVGQRIRDEILVIQRNNECKTGMMEEWHQKLHNNSSPDDVIICEALLNYVTSGFRTDVYWKTLNANGLTKEKLASYDRPITSEPSFSNNSKEGLVRDLTMYLKTLKAVHSGVDLESAIESCLGPPSQGHYFGSPERVACIGGGGLTPKLQGSLNFVRSHVADENIAPLMEKLLESRIELRPYLLTTHGKAKDLLFLDLALDSTVRTTMERKLKDLSFVQPPEFSFYITLVLENLCLSTVNNEDLIYCLMDWYRVRDLYKPNDSQWALQAKAILDRLQLILAERSISFHSKMQPTVQYLGRLLGIQKQAIDTATEELIRAGSAATLSALINRFNPLLRKVANLGCWQVISPVEVRGFVASVHDLATVQNKVYRKPTVMIATRVTGEEEIPTGVVAVLTPDMPDILSHVSIRARNSKVCFATCFDQNVLRNLKMKDGKVVSIKIKSMSLIISEISVSDLSPHPSVLSYILRKPAVTLRRKTFCGKYAVAVDEFSTEMVGAKSCNIRFLRERVSSWIKIPNSVALPFGTFEAVLSEDINKELASRILVLQKSVSGGDLTKLKEIQNAVQQMRAPLHLKNEMASKMRTSRIPWPGDQSEERWNRAWQAIKRVWGSKWNERAYISCRKANMNMDNLRMAVLIQEVVCADYAFVIHTKNPLSGDESEIYAEVVKGLGESLVNAHPGRALSFITRKNNLKNPIITSYPSKNIGLYSKPSIIFRSDSNGEDLQGYAGAGLYDSVILDEEDKVVLDYSTDRLVVDKAFQTWMLSRIAEAGKIIEALYGSPQDIEGAVKDGVIYVVQARPQIG